MKADKIERRKKIIASFGQSVIETGLKHEKFASKLNKVEMCGVTRLAADHPPMLKRRIEPRRRKSLLPCEKKSGAKAIHHVPQRLFGRPLHVPFWLQPSRRTIGPRTLNCGFRTGFANWKYLNALSKRDVKKACLSGSQKSKK